MLAQSHQVREQVFREIPLFILDIVQDFWFEDVESRADQIAWNGTRGRFLDKPGDLILLVYNRDSVGRWILHVGERDRDFALSIRMEPRHIRERYCADHISLDHEKSLV